MRYFCLEFIVNGPFSGPFSHLSRPAPSLPVFALHGLHFTVYAASIFLARKFYFACSPEEFCEFFFVFAWEFCIEKWREFLVNCFWSPSPTKRSTKSPRKIRGKFGAKFGGPKVEKFGKHSFCNFSDLRKLATSRARDEDDEEREETEKDRSKIRSTMVACLKIISHN